VLAVVVAVTIRHPVRVVPVVVVPEAQPLVQMVQRTRVVVPVVVLVNQVTVVLVVAEL